MSKKQKPNDHTPNKKKGSASRLGKFIAKTTLIASLLTGNPSFTQKPQSIPDLQKKNTTEVVKKQRDISATTTMALTKEFLSHTSIIKMNIQKILDTYGKKKGMEIIREHFLIELNIARSKFKSPPMKIDTTLNKIAHEHAQDMKDNDYFDHTDSKGRHVWDRAKDAGYEFSTISENIANGENIEDVISGFVHSKIGGHEIVLSREYSHIGIGIVLYQDNQKKTHTYFVLDFATPLQQ